MKDRSMNCLTTNCIVSENKLTGPCVITTHGCYNLYLVFNQPLGLLVMSFHNSHSDLVN